MGNRDELGQMIIIMGNRDELGQMIKGQHRYCLEKTLICVLLKPTLRQVNL